MNKEDYNCLHCGAVNKFKGYSYANKYCDNKCQKAFESKERTRQWLEEGKDWTSNIPLWAKRHLAEVNGDYCSVCGITEHNGLPIVLECDHIDGNHKNNTVDNLRLICPNCHSQTDTYKNKNKGFGRSYRSEQHLNGAVAQ